MTDLAAFVKGEHIGNVVWDEVSSALSRKIACTSLGLPRLLIESLRRWIRSCCTSGHSIASYVRIAVDLAEFCGGLEGMLALDQERVALWLARTEKGQAERSTWLRLSVARSWASWLESRGYRDRPLLSRRAARRWAVHQESVPRKPGMIRRALSQAQARKLARWAQKQRPEVCAAILLQLGAGLRSAEVADAAWEQVTRTEAGETVLVVQGKGRRQREIVLETAVVHALTALPHRTGSLVGVVSSRQVQRWAKAGAKALRLETEISSHDLRATHATLLFERGAALVDVQRRLGHASACTTETCYVRRPRKMNVTTGVR